MKITNTNLEYLLEVGTTEYNKPIDDSYIMTQHEAYREEEKETTTNDEVFKIISIIINSKNKLENLDVIYNYLFSNIKGEYNIIYKVEIKEMYKIIEENKDDKEFLRKLKFLLQSIEDTINIPHKERTKNLKNHYRQVLLEILVYRLCGKSYRYISRNIKCIDVTYRTIHNIAKVLKSPFLEHISLEQRHMTRCFFKLAEEDNKDNSLL